MLNVVQHARYQPQVARMTKRVGRRLRPIRASRQAELWYHNRLTDALLVMQARARKVLMQELRHYVAPGVRDANPWDKALRDLARDPSFMSLQGQADVLAKLTAKRALFWVDDKLAKEVSRALGVNIRSMLSSQGKVANRMAEFVNWNVQLISSLPDRMLEDLGDKLSDAWSSGLAMKSVKDIVDDVVDEAGGGYDANAKLIARDQMNKMNAAFNQVRQSEIGITKYQWRTDDDERVRSEHVKMESLDIGHGPGIFAWNEPGPLEGTIDGRPCHPGEDIQCRCEAIPVFDLDQMEAAVGL